MLGTTVGQEEVIGETITFHCAVVLRPGQYSSMVSPYHAGASPGGPFYKFGGK